MLGLKASAPLSLGRDARLDIARQGPQRTNGGLLLGNVLEEVNSVPVSHIGVRHLVDLVLLAVSVHELLPEHLGAPRPGGVRVRVVTLPRDVVHTDAVSIVKSSGVRDEASQEVLLEDLRATHAFANVEARPLVIREVTVKTVQEEGDPTNTTLRETDLEVREATEHAGHQKVRGRQRRELRGQDDQVVARVALGLRDEIERGPDVHVQHHVVVHHGREERVPVARSKGGQAHHVRGLREGDRSDAPLAQAVHLGDGSVHVPEVHHALRYETTWVGTTPVFNVPVVVGRNDGRTKVIIGDVRQLTAVEADHGGEVH